MEMDTLPVLPESKIEFFRDDSVFLDRNAQYSLYILRMPNRPWLLGVIAVSLLTRGSAAIRQAAKRADRRANRQITSIQAD